MSTGLRPQSYGGYPISPAGGSAVKPGPTTELIQAQAVETRARADMWNSFRLLAEAVIPIVAKIRTDFEAQPPG